MATRPLVVAAQGYEHYNSRISFVDEHSGRRLAMIPKRIRSLILILFLFSGSIALIFFTLPLLLIAPSETPKSDVILDFSLDSRSMADKYIVWLYREGIARTVVTVSSQISHETYPADYARDHLVALGIKNE